MKEFFTIKKSLCMLFLMSSFLFFSFHAKASEQADISFSWTTSNSNASYGETQYFIPSQNNLSRIIVNQYHVASDTLVDFHLCKGESRTSDDAYYDKQECSSTDEQIASTTMTIGASPSIYVYDSTSNLSFSDPLSLTPGEKYYFYFTKRSGGSIQLISSTGILVNGGLMYPSGYSSYTMNFQTNYDTEYQPSEYVYFTYPTDTQVVKDFPFWVLNYRATEASSTYTINVGYYLTGSTTSYLDYEIVPTVTTDSQWSIIKSQSLPEGNYSAFAYLFKNDVPISTSSIIFIVNQTNGQTFFGSSTIDSMDVHSLVCTSEEWASTDTWQILKCNTLYSLLSIWKSLSSLVQKIATTGAQSISSMFPFNLAFLISEAWSDSSNQLPSELSYFDIVSESGDLTLDVSSQFPGSTSTVIFGASLFPSGTATGDFLRGVKAFSTYVLWFLFIIGLVNRIRKVYNEILPNAYTDGGGETVYKYD